jgi:sodium-dependent dicarboxylate transporter 2/3/5
MSEDVRPGGTYRMLDEQQEVLTPAEERFEKARRTTGLFLGPLALLVMLLLPLGLDYAQQNLAAVLVLIPITKMVRSGVVFDIIGVVLVVLGITLMTRVVGLG